MNFTREPIILTVISPKEGSKLIVRNVLGVGEDIFVDAIEIVSFQDAIFFRSLERPKTFLFPTSHYEIIEVKETRMVLKNATAEKSIKIGGGARPQEEKKPEDNRPPQQMEDRRDRKKDKKRLRRRKPMTEEMKPLEEKQGGEVQDETQASSSSLKKLFPPPNVLIKERLARFKNEEFFEKNILPETVEEEKKETAVENHEEKGHSFSEENKETEEKESSEGDDLDEKKNREDSED